MASNVKIDVAASRSLDINRVFEQRAFSPAAGGADFPAGAPSGHLADTPEAAMDSLGESGVEAGIHVSADEEFDIHIDMNSTAELMDLDGVFYGGDDGDEVSAEAFMGDFKERLDFGFPGMVGVDVDGEQSVEIEEKELLEKTAKRRRGRPPKAKGGRHLPSDEEIDGFIVDGEQSVEVAEKGRPGNTAKRRRGRPPKAKADLPLPSEDDLDGFIASNLACVDGEQSVEVTEKEQPENTAKRGRGRPPKAKGDRLLPSDDDGDGFVVSNLVGVDGEQSVDVVEKGHPENTAKRRRGRPPKVKVGRPLPSQEDGVDFIFSALVDVNVEQSVEVTEKDRSENTLKRRLGSLPKAQGDCPLSSEEDGDGFVFSKLVDIDGKQSVEATEKEQPESTAKQGRGRPPKAKGDRPLPSDEYVDAGVDQGAELNKNELPESTTKLRRGRPPKAKDDCLLPYKEDGDSFIFSNLEDADWEQVVEVNKKEQPENTTKRRRGRPPKTKGDHPLPSEEDGDGFIVSDLVWGKVRCHPWWPGQILEPSAASDLAKQIMGKDNFLVAYFGDQTLACCEKSQLKHFHPYFSKMEKECSTDSFVDAVNDALHEVSRRVELGMACLCDPVETIDNLKYQKIENAGIKDGTLCQEVDRNLIASSFKPDMYVHYLKALAQCPFGEVDRLEFVTVKAQTKAFYLSKGYPELPQFHLGSLENNLVVSCSADKISQDSVTDLSSIVFSKDISWQGKAESSGSIPRKQEIEIEGGEKLEKTSLCEEVGVTVDDDITTMKRILGNPSSNRIQDNSVDDDSSSLNGVEGIGSLRVLETNPSLVPHNFFNADKLDEEKSGNVESKTGERNCHSINMTHHVAVDAKGASVDVSMDCLSQNEMLSQLCLLATDPLKAHDFLPSIVSFIMKFRESVFTTPTHKFHVQRCKIERNKHIDPKSHTFSTSNDHMQDSYWANSIFQNSSDEALLC